jgi:hypothetical protein
VSSGFGYNFSAKPKNWRIEFEGLRQLGYSLDIETIDEKGMKVWMMSRLA